MVGGIGVSRGGDGIRRRLWRVSGCGSAEWCEVLYLCSEFFRHVQLDLKGQDRGGRVPWDGGAIVVKGGGRRVDVENANLEIRVRATKDWTWDLRGH